MKAKRISILVGLLPDERERLATAATRAGLPLSTWIRMVALAAIPPTAPGRALDYLHEAP